MAHNPHLREDGKATQFKPGNTMHSLAKNPGRRPSFLKKMEKQYRFSSQDLNIILDTLATMNYDDFKKYASDPEGSGDWNGKLPMYVVTFAAAMIKDLSEGKTTTLMQMIDRLYGKPTERVETTIDQRMEILMRLDAIKKLDETT